jgi:hypothetical protein
VVRAKAVVAAVARRLRGLLAHVADLRAWGMGQQRQREPPNERKEAVRSVSAYHNSIPVLKMNAPERRASC